MIGEEFISIDIMKIAERLYESFILTILIN